MLHTKFIKVGPVVPGKKIFKVFLPYMGLAAILVMDQHYVDEFYYIVLTSLHSNNLVENGPVVSEKAS